MKLLNIAHRFSLAVLVFLCISETMIRAQHVEMKPKYPEKLLQEFEIIPSPPLQFAELQMEFKPEQADMNFDPGLKHVSALHRSRDQEDSLLLHHRKIDLVKNDPSIPRIGQDDTEYQGPFKITIGESFYGDIDGGCPNDNTIAVSRAGRIISMVNGQVGIFTTSGAKLNNYTLTEFFRGTTNASPCDPKVEYDPETDRFFMFAQDCGSDQTKFNIAFGFSKTNDPNGSWYIYKFSTDPFDDGSWSDYPKVAINQDEVFISLNLFGRSGGSYRQAIMYQLDKTAGFAGKTMPYKIWTGFKNGTAMPVRSGSRGQYGPGIYAIQTVAGGSDYINFYDITGKLGDASSQLIYKQIATTSYQPGSPAYQSGTSYRLDVGDCRCLDGYYQNGLIHFVFTAEDGSGYSGVRYHRFDPVKLDMGQYKFFSASDNRDYTYPSISPFSSALGDHTAVIHFASSGENFYPDMRAKLYHHDFSSDPSMRIHVGPGVNTDCYNGKYVRWGDYTGVCWHYGKSSPTVWVAGSVASSSSNIWWTYIAELNSMATATEDVKHQSKLSLYPNPAQDRIVVHFEVSEAAALTFAIFNTSGQLISNIFKSTAMQGSNEFSFSTGSLRPGIYFMKIINDRNEIVKTERFVVSE